MQLWEIYEGFLYTVTLLMLGSKPQWLSHIVMSEMEVGVVNRDENWPCWSQTARWLSEINTLRVRTFWDLVHMVPNLAKAEWCMRGQECLGGVEEAPTVITFGFYNLTLEPVWDCVPLLSAWHILYLWSLLKPSDSMYVPVVFTQNNVRCCSIE